MLSINHTGSTSISVDINGEDGSTYILKSHMEDQEVVSGETVVFTDLDPLTEYTFTSTVAEEVPEETLVGRVVITNSRTILSLAEVQLLNDARNTNFAPRGTATQSSTSHGGVASRAIDGNVNQDWSGGGITHTAKAGWWQLVFSSPVPASKIIILNRTGSSGLLDRLRGSVVTIYDQNGGVMFQQTLTKESRQGYTF